MLLRLESQQIMTSLAEARAALLQARIEARTVAAGAPKEEVAAVEAAIAEVSLQLAQQREDLVREEALLKKEATTREAVENLRKQINLQEVRINGLRQRQEALLHRYSEDEKQLQQNRVNELTRQVELLDQQVRTGSILASRSGVIYLLSVSPGAYVSRGQLLAQLYHPGRIRLRAYVDEPDLGRIQKGQRVMIDWDGLPDQHWQGAVDQPAKQIVTLGTRSIGYVVCTIDGSPKELIPNTNVKVQIVTASKAAALVIPRTAVLNQNGKPAVMWSDGERTVLKRVTLGLVTPEEIEILTGIEEGSKVVTNPGEAKRQ
jgi:multidrug efflux pump subunit AcrA (membrane-fusion protein)